MEVVVEPTRPGPAVVLPNHSRGCNPLPPCRPEPVRSIQGRLHNSLVPGLLTIDDLTEAIKASPAFTAGREDMRDDWRRRLTVLRELVDLTDELRATVRGSSL